jgi:hypothetical protein
MLQMNQVDIFWKVLPHKKQVPNSFKIYF